MALSIDNTSSGRSTSGGVTISHTTGTLSSGVMYVLTGVQDSNHSNFPITGITYNGVALTKIRSDEAVGNIRTEIWRLKNPDSGTHNVIVSTTGALGETAAVVATLEGADLTDTEEDNQGTSGNSSSPSIGVTAGNDGSIILTMCTAEATFSSNGTDQVTIATLTDQSYENSRGSYEEKASAGADTQSFSLASGQPWAISSVVVNAEAGGTDDGDERDAKITGTSSSTASVETTGTDDITPTTATLIGQIIAVGSSNITERGFQYNTVAYPDKEVSGTGDFGTGTYSLPVTGMSAGQTYYFRAFITDSEGTVYGSWQSFAMDESGYQILINSVDRTADVLNQSLSIEDVVNDKQNTISFVLMDLSSSGIPDPDQEIIVYDIEGTRIFGGYVTEVRMDTRDGQVRAVVRGIDYVRLLDRNLVHRSYEDMTVREIVLDIVDRYCAGFGITTNQVLEGPTIDQISFNYIQPSQAFRKLAELTGRNWYIDYEKDIHFFPTTTNQAPFDIDDDSTNYSNLKISKDATHIKNRVYVRGGTKLSDATTYSVKGDGVMTKFVLPDKPHDIAVEVNSVSKTVGIKNIDTSGYDWYLNYQEKYIEQDSGGSVLSTSDTLEITYSYDIPILVALENATSIAEHGVQEFAIFDKQITTTQAARDRASAELTDYASSVVEGSFRTYTSGFKSGQYINIDLTAYDIDADYIIQKVSVQSLGGGLFEYDVSVASVKTMGIIKFLIQLLESNRNIITLDDNEVVDELFNITDALLSDSLLDSLTIDSAGPYRTWCIDSLEETETRAIWNLFEWGGNS